MSARTVTLMRSAIAALGTLDAEELERLCAESVCLTAADAGTCRDQVELRALRQTLQELLRVTACNLRVLSSLRCRRVAGLATASEDSGEDIPWAR